MRTKSVKILTHFKTRVSSTTINLQLFHLFAIKMYKVGAILIRLCSRLKSLTCLPVLPIIYLTGMDTSSLYQASLLARKRFH